MSNYSGLERRYRRLLAWYPSAHRSSHGDEMIGVLLASAGDGQRRPHLADAVNLIGGGLRIRLRSMLGWRAGQATRDALAVFSVCVPAIWLISVVVLYSTLTVARFGRGTPAAALLFVIGYPAIEALFLAVPLWLGWRGRPKVGAAVAMLPAALFALVPLRAPGSVGSGIFACYSLLFAAEAAALVASPGPRRGAELMIKRTWAATASAGFLIGLWEVLNTFDYERAISRVAGLRISLALVIVVAVATGFLLTLRRPVAVRLLALFAVPAWLGGIGYLSALTGTVSEFSLFVLYLPALTLAGVTTVVGLVPRRWRRPGAQPTGS
jgi:hypothetical protein